MNNLLLNSKRFLKRNSSTILTIIGSIGVVVTCAIAIKDTPKALKMIEKKEEETGSELTNFEKVKEVWPVYIPTFISCVSTITCILGSNIVNKKVQASLISAYSLLDNSYKEYRKKLIELYGDDADKKIRTDIAKDKYDDSKIIGDEEGTLFYDECSSRYFRSTIENVLKAEYEINKKLSAIDSTVSLNEFYNLLNIPTVNYGDYLGWSSVYLFELYSYSWIEFSNEKFETDDGLEGYIISFTDPVKEFEEYWRFRTNYNLYYRKEWVKLKLKFDATKILSLTVTALGVIGTLLSGVVQSNELKSMKSEIKDEVLKDLSKNK